ncbi:MAG: hypothetical protein R3E60_08085 [Alphaproteobacteria bacterium]
MSDTREPSVAETANQLNGAPEQRATPVKEPQSSSTEATAEKANTGNANTGSASGANAGSASGATASFWPTVAVPERDDDDDNTLQDDLRQSEEDSSLANIHMGTPLAYLAGGLLAALQPGGPLGGAGVPFASAGNGPGIGGGDGAPVLLGARGFDDLGLNGNFDDGDGRGRGGGSYGARASLRASDAGYQVPSDAGKGGGFGAIGDVTRNNGDGSGIPYTPPNENPPPAEEPPPALPPLFTPNNDVVDFNSVVAGTYLAGTPEQCVSWRRYCHYA